MQKVRKGFETIDFPLSLVRSDFPVFGFVRRGGWADGRCDLFEGSKRQRMAGVAAERASLVRCARVRVCGARRTVWQADGSFDSESIGDDASTEVAKHSRCARPHHDRASMWLLVRLWLSSRPSADGPTLGPSAGGRLPVHIDAYIGGVSTYLNHMHLAHAWCHMHVLTARCMCSQAESTAAAEAAGQPQSRCRNAAAVAARVSSSTASGTASRPKQFRERPSKLRRRQPNSSQTAAMTAAQDRDQDRSRCRSRCRCQEAASCHHESTRDNTHA